MEKTEKEPTYREKMKQTLDLKGRILKDFGVFAIIEWLKKLSSTQVYFSGFGRNPPRVLFKGESESCNLPEKLKEENIFVKNVRSPLPFSLPKNTKIRVQNNNVIVDCGLMKVNISIDFYMMLRGIDLRLQQVLDIPKEKLMNYATLSGVISFNADFSFWSVFQAKADDYYGYAKEMLENLRCIYSWSEFINSLRELTFWKHMLEEENS